MRKASYILTFLSGVAIGAAAAWYGLKTRYEQLAQEEIDSVKEAFSKKKEPEQPKETAEKQEFTDYSARAAKYQPKDEREEDKIVDKPYVISPDEFGEFEDYEKISLIFYSDGILIDDNYEPVDDVEDLVGAESLNHFGEYEDDSVFVRNDRLKCDYEILLDHREYGDVRKTMPHPKED